MHQLKKLGFSLLILTCAFVSGYENGLEVRTPKPDAKVFLDDKYMGQTQTFNNINILIIENLKPGKHHLKCEVQNYNPYSTIVEIPTNRMLVHRVEFTVAGITVETLESTTGTQVKQTGTITVKSKPSNAYVSLDGNNINGGSESLTDLAYHNVSIGSHEVEVYFDRYNPDQVFKIEVVLSQGENLIIVADFIESQISVNTKYTLNVVSNPPGKVRINNIDYGYTPISKKLPYGFYKLSISKPGYSTYFETLMLNSNALINKELMVELGRAHLTIEEDDIVGAERITINGSIEGFTPLETIINEGENKIQIGSRTKTVNILKDHSYKITLSSNDPALVKDLREIAPKPTLMPEYGYKSKYQLKTAVLRALFAGSFASILPLSISGEPDIVLGTWGTVSTLYFIYTLLPWSGAWVAVEIPIESNIALNNKMMAEWELHTENVNRHNENILQQLTMKQTEKYLSNETFNVIDLGLLEWSN